VAKRGNDQGGIVNIQPLLLQRLTCYRFAYVMADPEFLASRLEWQIPDLRGSFPRDEKVARTLNLATPCLGERSPILSTSLERLCHFRRQDGMRPLILLRPAFERPIPVKRLAGLAKVPPILQRMMLKDDAYLPLEWRRPMQRLMLPNTAVQAVDLREHPMVRHLQAVKAAVGSARYFLQEDGFLIQQPELLMDGPKQFLKLDRRALGRYDEAWYQSFGHLSNHTYIISKSKQQLEWFARDSLRILGPHTYRWMYPAIPDPRNGGRNWILVQDRDMQWDCLARRIPAVFLDDDGMLRNYRRLRLGKGGRLRWRTMDDLQRKGILRLFNMTLLCQDRGSGWQLAFADGAARDASPALTRRLDQLATLIA
jgi:hypothetical protein